MSLIGLVIAVIVFAVADIDGTGVNISVSFITIEAEALCPESIPITVNIIAGETGIRLGYADVVTTLKTRSAAVGLAG